MNGWMDRKKQMDKKGLLDGQMDGWMDGKKQKDGQMDIKNVWIGKMDGWIKQIDGRLDQQKYEKN